MEVIVKHKQNTAQHPNIHSIINRIFEIKVNHFRRSVHQGCVFLKSFFVLIHFGFGNLGKIYSLSAATTQITQFSCSIFCQKYVLYFYVLMENSQLMHLLQPQHSILQYFQYFSLTQGFFLFVILSNQIINSLFSQLHQNVALEIFVSLYLIGTMVANHVRTGRQLLHDLNLIFIAVLGLLVLAYQFFERIMSFRICVFNQEYIAVPSLCYLMYLSESFAVDVEPSTHSKPCLYYLQASTHYYQQFNYTWLQFKSYKHNENF